MEAYLKIILFFAICFAFGYVECATKCYSCGQCPDPFNNITTPYVNCSNGADTCLKSTIRYPGGSFVSKACVASSLCKESSINVAGLGYWLTCCTGDLCNSANRILNTNTFAHVGSIVFGCLIINLRR
ncbi:unnamed protein product [Brachionus calyciflorus]|uniref:Snake toxin/toxin-like domain-containing protein n=1 Tax=Brachionus calyciflorus TaxID=104777 RepID=A0A813PP28_9BILA|nr:unnamed protein product [Brachionus calyciflorus]